MTTKITKLDIASEEAAWNILAQAMSGELDDQSISISVDDWASIHIRVEGKGYASTITPKLMASFIELQKSLNRSAARVLYNDENANRLTDDDRKAFEFVVVVSKGSSKFDIDLSEIIKQMIDKVGAKMTGRDLVITIVTLAVLYTGNTAWKSYLDSMADAAKADTPVQLSRVENERLAILRDILAERPALNEIREDVMDVQHQILKGTVGAKTTEMQGNSVTGAEAQVLTKSKRERSRDVHIEGQFRVLAVDTTNPELVKVKLRRKGEEFIAHFKDDSLNARQVAILKDHLMSRKPVHLQVNATELRGRYTAAEITSIASAELTRRSSPKL